MQLEISQSYNLHLDLEELQMIRNGLELVLNGYELNNVNLTREERSTMKKLRNMIQKLDITLGE
jgi:hypothetical protein